MLTRRFLASANALLNPQLNPALPQFTASIACGRSFAAASAPPDLRKAFAYCVDQVKKHDYESYLWATQLPKHLRAPMFALRAFYVETGLIGQLAKTEMLVLMRCQWWRDAINDCFKGKQVEQPIMTALAEVLRVAPLTRYRLQQIVSSREEDLLSHAQHASLAALERYAEGTAGQLLLLQLEAAGVASGGGQQAHGGNNSEDGGSSGSASNSGSSEGAAAAAGEVEAAAAAAAEHGAAHLGKAVGLVGLLHGTYALGRQRRVYLPADLCQQHGVSFDDVLIGRDSAGLRDVTLAVASAAKQNLEAARGLAGDAPPPVRPLFAPAVAADMYLAALERAEFNPFDQKLLRGGFSPLAYQLRLKWALLRDTY